MLCERVTYLGTDQTSHDQNLYEHLLLQRDGSHALLTAHS